MDKGLIELINLLMKSGIEREFLDGLAGYFNVDAASVVALKDFDITFAKTSSYFGENSLDILKLYRQTKHNNVYFERSIKKGYCIVQNYQGDKLANPMWKKVGLKSVFLYSLNTEFNSVIALESFSQERVFNDADLAKMKFISPFVSRSIENAVYKELLEKEIVRLDVELPNSVDKNTLRVWLADNLGKIMNLTKAKAISLIYPKYGIYSFATNDKNVGFVKFRKTKEVESLLVYRMYQEKLKAPAVFVYGMSNKSPKCLEDVYKRFGVKNVLVVPVWDSGRLEGVFGYGYQTDMYFSLYDVNIVKLITKRLFQLLNMSFEFSRLSKVVTKNEEEIINSFVMTIEMRDVYTKGHSQRVAFYAKRIAQKLRLNEKFADKIYVAGLLHDVGKIGVPDAVLMKPSKLSDVEYEMIKYHPVLSYKIVDQFKSLKDLKTIAKMVRHHHERCDGRGYPDGLMCEKISKGAKILAVADVFDALTTSRPYRKAFEPKKAIEIMLEEKGHLDEKILNRALDVLIDSFEEAIELGESSLIPKAFDEYKRKFSHVDSLTGLLTRSALLRKLDDLIKGGNDFRTYMVDVKGMDSVNIECGSEKGDLLLIKVAETIKNLSELGCEHFTRYGGDSFVFICESHFNDVDDFLAGLAGSVKGSVDCPKSLRFTTVHVNSKEIGNTQELILLLRKRKNLLSHRA